ncbi:MAG: hypothetical protein QF440_03495 [Candidatus Thalassarchaeaceae archaeon]|nr:hypothetical protein [Candidatus Thalassarchaeaceae archaeon]
MSDPDPLSKFDNLAVCPSCSTLAEIGTTRCPECGAFHIQIDYEEKPEDDVKSIDIAPQSIKEDLRDPEFYSVDPRGEIPVEHFDGDEDVVTDWEGSSIDFDIGDDDE